MKKKIVFAGILGVMMVSGCAQKEFVFTQDSLCPSPIVDVFLQASYKKGDQGSMNEREFNALLKQVAQNTGCIRLVDSAKVGVFALTATFESKLTQAEQKGTFKSSTENVLSTKVTLNLNNQKIIRRDFGESKITAQENKVLGLGQEEQISQDDERKAFQASILGALQNFINATKATLKKSEEESQDALEQNF